MVSRSSRLSSLERLPTEILQHIWLLSLSLDLPRASLMLSNKIQSPKTQCMFHERDVGSLYIHRTLKKFLWARLRLTRHKDTRLGDEGLIRLLFQSHSLSIPFIDRLERLAENQITEYTLTNEFTIALSGVPLSAI